MQRHLILVCHAADGHFANGNRDGVLRVFDRLRCAVAERGRGHFDILCADGGSFELVAPGLNGSQTFHRMELVLNDRSQTKDVLRVILELMRVGGFGLMDSLSASQFIVASPQQVGFFPWLPEPPLLVRNVHDLGYTIDHPAA